MNCSCVHAGNSRRCSAIECPSYSRAITVGSKAVGFIAVATAVILLVGSAVNYVDDRRGGSVMDGSDSPLVGHTVFANQFKGR